MKTYFEMYEAIPTKRDLLKNKLENNGCRIISDVFVAVGDEEKELYFVDVEYSDIRGNYNRIYGLKKI